MKELLQVSDDARLKQEHLITSLQIENRALRDQNKKLRDDREALKDEFDKANAYTF